MMRFFSFCLLVFVAATAQAAEAVKTDAALEQQRKTIEQSLQKARGDLQVESVAPSAIDGLVEVYLAGGMMLYASADGSHIVDGKLFRIENSQFVDVREEKLRPVRAKILAQIPEADTIAFKPEKETKALVYAFTDIDCGYCQKFHHNMAAYNDLGIEVRYLAFPRAGANSSSAQKLETAWCSKDKQQAMTALKNRQAISPASCDNPVAAQYDLGQRLGVTGTPSLFTADGTLIPGYREPAQLAKDVGL